MAGGYIVVVFNQPNEEEPLLYQFTSKDIALACATDLVTAGATCFCFEERGAGAWRTIYLGGSL